MQASYLGSFNELRPAVNFAGKTAGSPAYQWGPRIIPDYQLIYVISGRAELRLGRERFELRPGDAGLYGGGTPMVLKSCVDERYEYYSIHFDWDRESAVPMHPSARMIYCGEEQMEREPCGMEIEFGNAGRMTVPLKQRAPQLEESIRLLVEEYQQQLPGYELALRGRMILLLAAMLRRLQEAQVPDCRRKIEPALLLLERQPDRAWPVPELARACGYQTAYFTKLFKAAMGASPKAYMIEQRIRLAKRFLLDGEPVEAIAERLGYGSTHYLYRSFKEATGMTPAEFRMQGE